MEQELGWSRTAINGALAAPFTAAVIWSLSGGYDAVLWTVFAGALIAVAGFWFASRPHAL